MRGRKKMRSKRLGTAVLIIAVVLMMYSGAAFADKPDEGYTGNNSPKEKKLYSLNILGKAWDDKEPIEDCNQGNRIFVRLGEPETTSKGKGPKYSESSLTQIMLYSCEEITGDPCCMEFGVLDCDGATDGEASFMLPDPDLDPYDVNNKGSADTMSSYSVFVRPLGKPGGFAEITTCAEVNESNLAAFMSAQDAKALNEACLIGDGVASVEQVGQEITMRTKGKKKFENVTAELLTIVLLVEVDYEDDDIVDYTTYVRVPIFNDILEGEYWQYDNKGLRVLQVRFYDMETDVSEGDGELPAL
jgi:hypothetical protein